MNEDVVPIFVPRELHDRLQARANILRQTVRQLCEPRLESLLRRDGLSATPEYGIWYGMKRRCDDPTMQNYHLYGGRGIDVCPEWRASFATFFQDMGMRPGPKDSIERIDNYGNYEPGNCRWATMKEQGSNKRNNRRLSAFGERKTLKQWWEDKRCVVPFGTYYWRLEQGWSVEKAITTPADPKYRNKNHNED